MPPAARTFAGLLYNRARGLSIFALSSTSYSGWSACPYLIPSLSDRGSGESGHTRSLGSNCFPHHLVIRCPGSDTANCHSSISVSTQPLRFTLPPAHAPGASQTHRFLTTVIDCDYRAPAPARRVALHYLSAPSPSPALSFRVQALHIRCSAHSKIPPKFLTNSLILFTRGFDPPQILYSLPTLLRGP